MLGHDVVRAGLRAAATSSCSSTCPSSTSPTPPPSPRCSSSCRSRPRRRRSTAPPGPTSTAPRPTRGGARRQRRRGRQPRARGRGGGRAAGARLDRLRLRRRRAASTTQGAPAPLRRVRPHRPALGLRRRASSRASIRCWRPRPRHAVVRTRLAVRARRAQLRRDDAAPGRASATSVQVVTDQIGCPTWTGHLAPALLGSARARGVAGSCTWPAPGRSPGTASRRRSSARPRSTAASSRPRSEQMARPAPRPAWSALESEREDVLPLPPWQDGLAGYLAARAGMMRA